MHYNNWKLYLFPETNKSGYDSDAVLDTTKLQRLSCEMQEMSSDTLISKISQWIPIINDLKSGKVSKSCF